MTWIPSGSVLQLSRGKMRHDGENKGERKQVTISDYLGGWNADNPYACVRLYVVRLFLRILWVFPTIRTYI